MKKILPILLALLSGVAFSACSTDDNTSVPPTPRQTAYSYEYLKSVQDDISAYFQGFDKEGYQNDPLCQIICGVYIADGFVQVSLTEPTEENIALFKEKVNDSDAIVFRQGTKFHADQQ